MKGFIRELRRREVLRTTGLYVGICWILIEVGSVVLPAFGAPEWLFRGTIIVAIAGFPVMLVLAWFFDASKKGVSLQAGPNDGVAENLGARKSDFAIIGVLLLALVVSVSLNLKGEQPVAIAPEPIRVLVEDFSNQTGNAAFDSLLNEAFAISLEVAPHVGVVDSRHSRDADHRLGPGKDIEIVMTGALVSAGTAFRLSVEGNRVADNSTVFEISENAESADDVIEAINKLAAKARKALGRATPADPTAEAAQAFVTSSVTAAEAYSTGKQSERAGDFNRAAASFKQAVLADPDFGQAVMSLALTEFALGRMAEAQEHWDKSRQLIGTVTAREQVKGLARYHILAEGDGEKAAKTLADLVKTYPADVEARDDYAEVAFRQLDFSTALEQFLSVENAYSASDYDYSLLAKLATYAGEWATANRAAEQAVSADPANEAAYFSLAMSAMAAGDTTGAREAYARMRDADIAGVGASMAVLGLADIDMYLGAFNAADARLKTGIDTDVENDRSFMAAAKTIALAQFYAEHSKGPAAIQATTRAVALDNRLSIIVPSAMLEIANGNTDNAAETAAALAGHAEPLGRAYGQMLTGLILEQEGSRTQAILAFREALEIADAWFIRLQLGKTYFRAEKFPEALDELSTLQTRQAEASSVFVDGLPSYRLAAELPFWLARSQQALNMQSAARANFEMYLSLRPEGGTHTQEAARHLAELD